MSSTLSYTELKKKHMKETEKFPLEFAFGGQQFKEMMVSKFNLDPAKDLDKVVSLGSGIYLKKADVGAYKEMCFRHRKEIRDAIDSDESGEGFVCQMFYTKLVNTEYGYTGDAEDALAALGYSYSKVKKDPKLWAGFQMACEKAM